jgi:hypothetical protein
MVKRPPEPKPLERWDIYRAANKARLIGTVEAADADAAIDGQIRTIAASLRDNLNVRFIAPAHCTGEPAFAILKESFGDRYIYAGLGTTVLLGPKVTVKAEAGQPNKQAMDAEDLRSYREAVMRSPFRPFFGGAKRLARTQQ